jgi:uncharacterized protein (DUF2225 family)
MFKIYKVDLCYLCKYTNITQSVKNIKKGIDISRKAWYTIIKGKGKARKMNAKRHGGNYDY